jgi:hypothetical protein
MPAKDRLSTFAFIIPIDRAQSNIFQEFAVFGTAASLDACHV